MKHFSPSNPYDITVFLCSLIIAFTGAIIISIQQHAAHPILHISKYNADEYTINKILRFSSGYTGVLKEPFWIIGSHRYRLGKTIQYNTGISGPLRVVAVLNNSIAAKNIIIAPAKVPTPTVIIPRAVIFGPAQVFAGTPCIYYCKNDSAIAYQWKLLSDSNCLQTSNTFRFTFRTPGEQLLTLTLNNNPATTIIKSILVLAPTDKKPLPALVIPDPIPVIPSSAISITPSISDSQFKQLFLQLLEEKKEERELAQYLCHQLETVVIINDKQSVSFLQCYTQLQNRKNIRLLSLSLARSEQGCITAIRIRYDKKKFIGLF
ncbi:hypothetical protein [Chitinophaga sp. sic0106]|uniref:hypothetical protein n=1 Tax=Chitinophaga sp. sic0106 TaxID=2854785 RepID=UPI001C46387B|nr:hypothetical protein [Chitinophaga sp. sic0106]MBV7532256.1 hypothetical protein [Chitinophaga sp. sic0106]